MVGIYAYDDFDVVIGRFHICETECYFIRQQKRDPRKVNSVRTASWSTFSSACSTRYLLSSSPELMESLCFISVCILISRATPFPIYYQPLHA